MFLSFATFSELVLMNFDIPVLSAPSVAICLRLRWRLVLMQVNNRSISLGPWKCPSPPRKPGDLSSRWKSLAIAIPFAIFRGKMRPHCRLAGDRDMCDRTSRRFMIAISGALSSKPSAWGQRNQKGTQENQRNDVVASCMVLDARSRGGGGGASNMSIQRVAKGVFQSCDFGLQRGASSVRGRRECLKTPLFSCLVPPALVYPDRPLSTPLRKTPFVKHHLLLLSPFRPWKCSLLWSSVGGRSLETTVATGSLTCSSPSGQGSPSVLAHGLWETWSRHRRTRVCTLAMGVEGTSMSKDRVCDLVMRERGW